MRTNSAREGEIMKNAYIKNRLGDGRANTGKGFALALAMIAGLVTTGLLARAQASADDFTAQVVVGNLDASFGSGGKVSTLLGEFSEASDLCIQADGKTVAAGFAQMKDNDQDFALARYNDDGSLDTSFGSGGKVTTDFFGNPEEALSVIVQPNGKIVVAGYTYNKLNDSSSVDFALARYNADGSLDTPFGAGGRVTTDFFGDDDQAQSVTIQPDGKIVAAGFCKHGTDFSTTDAALARYNSDGTLDKTFGSGGKVATDFFGMSDGFNAVVIRPDGKIVAAGGAIGSGGTFVAAFAQYNSDGSLDSSFGGGGKATLNVLKSIISRVALQSDGKVAGVGRAVPGTTGSDILLARLKPDGSLDTSFGSSGIVLTDFFGQNDLGTGMVVQPDGKLVVSAGVYLTRANASEDFALARYNSDGSLDNSFGFGGKVTTDFSGGVDGASSIAIQANGNIVVAGFGTVGVDWNDVFALARYFGDSPLPPAARLPIIQGATIQGKKLIVTGLNYDIGAVVLIDGEKQKTANDDQQPENVLIARKAGKFIAPGQTVTIQVKNTDDRVSNSFTFTRP
jgi:uncharacterized delta-60 repeat protein